MKANNKTPFEAAGYTKNTIFRVLDNWGNFKKGDLVKIAKDDGTYSPYFRSVTHSNVWEFMYLPSEKNIQDGLDDLEVVAEKTE